MALSKILIANRGEIAVRIIRAARELGIKTVQIHSTADTESLAVHMADEAVEIGPPPAQKSYLDTAAILRAARDTGADAIHPGYGFLSENADFAEAVTKAGIIFIGPSSEVIRIMGDKAAARKTARQAGVPIVPGSDGVITDSDERAALADKIGYPVMLKATAGGGGRGIRIANNAEQLSKFALEASAEANAIFGNGGLYLEKIISKARHIEVQILADGKNFIHLYERECSLQRRCQKVWEEAPCSALSPQVREELCLSAVNLAAAVNYSGAGTVEYLYDDQSGRYYFIEMNTRIQVEHPVTESILGIDILQEMIRIAGGEELSLTQNDIKIRGHAIEVRINAEDPAANFMPSPGLVNALTIPGGPGVRFDHMLYHNCQITPFYDSLIGKLIVSAETRQKAITRLKHAISELYLGEIKTTAPLFVALADSPDVIAGHLHTRWLETWLEDNAETLTTQKGFPQ